MFMEDEFPAAPGNLSTSDEVREDQRSSLRFVLVSKYKELRRKLTLRLGSRDLAEDVLHDIYLRLDRRSDQGPVANPQAYLLQAAANLATDRRRADRRLLSSEEVATFLDIDDGKPVAEDRTDSHLEMSQFQKALAELPERRREILLAARVDELPHREIAARFSISTRTVEIELKRALEHCAAKLNRKNFQRFGPRGNQSSKDNPIPNEGSLRK